MIFIIKAEIDCDRPNVESLEGRKFKTISDLYNDEDFKELKRNGKVLVQSISEFTKDWNDTDDSDDYLRVFDYFICYIEIEE